MESSGASFAIVDTSGSGSGTSRTQTLTELNETPNSTAIRRKDHPSARNRLASPCSLTFATDIETNVRSDIGRKEGNSGERMAPAGIEPAFDA